jgi:hypothetical protein
MKLKTPYAPPIAVASGLWLLLSLAIVLIPLRSLVMTPWLIDDSFIFMQIARNLATGHGYSFDGVTPTSGAPVLWTLFTSLNHQWLGPIAAAKATMIESTFFSMAASVVVYILATFWYERTIAWGAFLLSLFSTPMFLQSMNGMETGLFALIGLLAILSYIQARRKDDSLRWYVSTGVLLGLLNLTRMDGVFLGGAIGLIHLVYFSQHLKSRRVVLGSIALVGFLVLFTLPTLLWSWYVSGSLLPANQAGRHFLAWQGIAPFSLTYFYNVLVLFYRLSLLFQITIGASLIILPLLVFWAYWQRDVFPYSAIILIYIVAYCGTLLFYQWYFPDVHGLRYLHLPGHLMSIPVAALVYAIATIIKQRINLNPIALYSTALAILLVLSAVSYADMVRVQCPWARELDIIPLHSKEEYEEWWQFLEWVNANTPPGTVIAAKDHGRLAYFTHARVVDLAGIIDPILIEKFFSGELRSYLHDEGIEYIIMPGEGGNLLFQRAREVLPLERVTDAPSQESTRYWLYRVTW